MKDGLLRSATGTGRQKMSRSIRGKISNPIPIPTAGDENFPSRNPGSSPPRPHVPENGDSATPHPSNPHGHHHKPVPSSSSLPYTGPSRVSGNPSEVAHGKDGGSDNSLPSSAALAGSSGPTPSSGIGMDPSQRRTSHSAQVRYSAISTSSQTGGTSNRDSPQRKKSTIRGALSKLFGRKKKSKSQSSTGPTPSSGTSIQHRSVSLCVLPSPNLLNDKTNIALTKQLSPHNADMLDPGPFHS